MAEHVQPTPRTRLRPPPKPGGSVEIEGAVLLGVKSLHSAGFDHVRYGPKSKRPQKPTSPNYSNNSSAQLRGVVLPFATNKLSVIQLALQEMPEPSQRV